jgi:hypothetical protein
MFFRFNSVLAGVTGVACALVIISGAPAVAGTLSFDRVNVMTAGKNTTAINQCIKDAQDGTINTAIVQCNQVATSQNTLVLRDANVIVYPSGSWIPSLYRNFSTNTTFSGGTTDHVIACLEDSRDGSIDYAFAECKRASISNSYLVLIDTDVEIDD